MSMKSHAPARSRQEPNREDVVVMFNAPMPFQNLPSTIEDRGRETPEQRNERLRIAASRPHFRPVHEFQSASLRFALERLHQNGLHLVEAWTQIRTVGAKAPGGPKDNHVLTFCFRPDGELLDESALEVFQWFANRRYTNVALKRGQNDGRQDFLMVQVGPLAPFVEKLEPVKDPKAHWYGILVSREVPEVAPKPATKDQLLKLATVDGHAAKSKAA